ncbi:MAG: hypothetical protein ABSA54_18100 [Terriglobales bacterium]|jgi:hypothetical protein
MRRTSSKSAKNSTQSSHLERKLDATRLIRDLTERVTKLEKAFESAVAPLDLAASEIPVGEPKRPGPKPIHFWGLLSDRDTLVQTLEYYWPELEPLCWPKPKPKILTMVLEAIPKQRSGWYAQASKHLVEQIDTLVEFISTDRFRRDPRQIANAFAGFPKVSIWRSLKLCQSSPCNHPIGSRAIKSYIRRRHPELFRNLDADYSLPNFASALRAYRTKDQKLTAFRADYLYQSWKQCKPDYAAIAVNLQPAARKAPEQPGE